MAAKSKDPNNVRQPRVRLGKTKLNDLMKKLPIPVQEHSARCKKLADFLIERAQVEDWFIDSDLNPEVLRSVIYYHDIGKSRLSLDYIYSKFCSDDEQLAKYQMHADEGQNLIESEFVIVLDSYPDHSFEKELKNAVTQHHEKIDGTGFPRGLDIDTISLTGKITAVIDIFDNLLFDSNFDCLGSIEELKKLSGRTLENEIVDCFIAEPETLAAFVSNMNASHERKRRDDTFGFRLMFDPIFNIFDSNEYKHVVFGYNVTLYINDPYFGLIGPEAFMVAAEKTGQIYKLDKLAYDKLIRLFLDIRDEGISLKKPLFFRVSFAEFDKPEIVPEKKKTERKNVQRNVRADAELVAKPGDNKLLAHIKRVNLENNIPFGQMVLTLPEEDIVDSGFDINQLENDMRDSGIKFSIGGFAKASSVVTLMDTSKCDYVMMSPELTREMQTNERTRNLMSGITNTLGKLDLEPIFLGVETAEQRAMLIRAGARYATVPMWSHSLDSKEFTKYVKDDQNGGESR